MLFVQNKSVAIRIKFNKMKFFIGEASSTIFFLFPWKFLAVFSSTCIFLCNLYIFYLFIFKLANHNFN